jgi:hypothetical protein
LRRTGSRRNSPATSQSRIERPETGRLAGVTELLNATVQQPPGSRHDCPDPTRAAARMSSTFRSTIAEPTHSPDQVVVIRMGQRVTRAWADRVAKALGTTEGLDQFLLIGMVALPPGVDPTLPACSFVNGVPVGSGAPVALW